jgi:aldose 1-epimerase
MSREVVLRSDELEVVLLPELGARIHRLRAFGIDLLRTPPDHEVHERDPFFWGAYVMAPWCNRVAAHPFDVAGRTVDLAPNFPDGTAIHGQVYARPWLISPDGPMHVGGGDDGWPWAYHVTALPAVERETLTIAYELENRSDVPMPAGIGLHPWFRAPVEVAISADAVYPSNVRSPAEAEQIDNGLDLRTATVPSTGTDVTYTRLQHGRVALAWPDAGTRADMEIEGPNPLVAVAAPADLDAVAVEPQTHGPDGLRRLAGAEADAPMLLAPGETLRLALRLTVRRATTEELRNP